MCYACLPFVFGTLGYAEQSIVPGLSYGCSAVPRTVEQVLTSFPRKRATQPRVNCHMLLSRDHVSSAFRGHNLCMGLQPDPQRSSRGGRRQTRETAEQKERLKRASILRKRERNMWVPFLYMYALWFLR